MEVQLLVRSYSHRIGLARYVVSLCRAMDRLGIPYRRVTPDYPWPIRTLQRLLQPMRLDAVTFFTTYPVAAPLKQGVLTHLTAQQMATLLLFYPALHPTIVTVHDIVPYLTRDQYDQRAYRNRLEEVFDQLATSALKRADALIADSNFTRATVIRLLGYPEERVAVVPLGVDHTVFRPQLVPSDFDRRYGLDSRCRYVLYVGSENPRKNLLTLLRALALLRQTLPDVCLIRVGATQYLSHARVLQEWIERLNLIDAVLHFPAVPDEDLVLFYNRADLFVFPSLYEGFGLPVLEAMACGTPVICSSAASLPEVAGDAAILVSPHSEKEIADGMIRALTDAGLRRELSARGVAQAQKFTWERTAEKTAHVYAQVWEKYRRGG